MESGAAELSYGALCAAASWGVAEAWPHIKALISSPDIPKHLLLVAIDAAVALCPEDARALLHPLIGAADEDIAEAVDHALDRTEAAWDDGAEDDEVED